MAKHRNNKTINPAVSKKKGDQSERFIDRHNVISNGDSNNCVFVLKYLDTRKECFSDWQPPQLKDFSAFIIKAQNLEWSSIKSHSGLRFKILQDQAKCRKEFDPRNILDQDIKFSELRVSKQSRVFGFRYRSAFFIIRLDANHRVFP